MNPFDTPATASSASNSTGTSRLYAQQQQQSQPSSSQSTTTSSSEPPIWAARHVDWPILSSLSQPLYHKLLQQSQTLGNEYGISYPHGSVGETRHPGSSSSSSTSNAAKTSSSSSSKQASSSTLHSSTSGTGPTDGTDASSSSYGLTGFMNRVLNTGTTHDGKDSTSAQQQQQQNQQAHLSSSSSSMGGSNRPLRPPRAHCVAAANGWIVAVLEQPPSSSTSTTSSAAALGSSSTSKQSGTGGSSSSTHASNSASSTTTTNATSTMSMSGGVGLRLISRWNVRRGSLTGTSWSDHWMALPPPIVGSLRSRSNEGRIKHVLVDPTASHTLISANNGEAYYLHSSGSQRLVKLPGFGPSAPLVQSSDHATNSASSSHHHHKKKTATTPTRGNQSSSHTGNANSAANHTVPLWMTAGLHLTGIPATAVAHLRDEQSQASIQAGLTLGSYVTAIAWDKERGTEGSSKRVLLGTSLGEIYEYTFPTEGSHGMNHGDETGTTSHRKGGGTSGSSSGGGGSSSQDHHKRTSSSATSSLLSASSSNLPILLHKLSSSSSAGGGSDPASMMDPSQVGAAVTGLYFERLRTGLLVICATSGRGKRTRFYSFYSPHNSSFRKVLADQQYATLVELPGSVDFADMVTVGDGFGLRTAVGIYHGRIDRSLTNAAATVAAGGSASMIVDSGMLSYETIFAKAHSSTKTNHHTMPTNSSSNNSNAISLALTPHHFIVLTESNHVCFINRVAQKIIQKDRVDGSSTTTQGSSKGNDDTSNSILATGSTSSSSFLVGALLMDIRRPDQVWLRQGRQLVHISSSQEDRDVWKYTLQKCLDMPLQSKSSTSSGSASGTTSSAKRSSEQTGFDVFVGKPLTEEEKAQEALFEQAKALCSNAAQKAVVTAARAEYHLAQGRTELAAKYFALCPSALAPFADTAVRLALPKLGIDDPKSYGGSAKAWASLESSNVPLITYLADKMRVGKMNNDRMTCTMIGAWLTELFLHERGERRANAPLLETAAAASTASMEDSALLSQFLNNNVNNMEAKTIMKILTSHDVGAHECALYAARSGDIATAVNAALNVGAEDTRGAYEALTILGEAPFELAEPLYYRHASILLSRAPGAAVDGFLARYAEGLSPSRVLPSIMNYEQRRASRVRARAQAGGNDRTDNASDGDGDRTTESYDVSMDHSTTVEGLELSINRTMVFTTASFVEDANAAIRFLEGVIQQGCQTGAIFSYLVSLYAKLDDEEPLLKFLTTHVPVGASPWADNTSGAKSFLTVGSDYGLSGPLDMSAALRTVLASGRHYRSAIKLYMGFGMRQQAVELALKVDPSLARELAQESVELEERKRLWLMIAKNAASDSASRGGKDVVSRVVSVLKDCGPDVLSIEDVLPFLPDFAQIDQIKDEICEALTSYSSRIEGFLREMSDCDQTCDHLRHEIVRLKSRQMRVKTNARCAMTDKLVLKSNEPFYVFPSGYVILASAVKKAVMPYLNEKQRERVQELEEELKSPSAGTDSSLQRDKLQSELDGLIAAECPLTGTVMIESIDRGFEDDDDLDFGPLDVERAEV